MRVAAIDLGTNTTRLLIADVNAERVEEISRRTTITRLGEGVDGRRRLLPLPIARVRNVLADYRRELESLGAERTLAAATSAVRDAENGEAFLGEIEWSYGFTTRLLTGEEEAELTLRGVGEVGHDALVVDIGGGSTELIGAGTRISTELGSVRLTERFLPSDPPTEDELDALGAATRSVLADLPLTERRRVPGLEPERAPVIVAGAVVLREVLRHFGLASIEASERDILYGIALEAAALPEPVEGDAPPGAYTCC